MKLEGFWLAEAGALQQGVRVACRKLVEKADFHTLWELLQWYPRDYLDFRPAYKPWEDGAAIKGVGRVLYRGLRGPAAIVDLAADVSPPTAPDDGGYFSGPGDEDRSDGAQPVHTSSDCCTTQALRLVVPCACAVRSCRLQPQSGSVRVRQPCVDQNCWHVAGDAEAVSNAAPTPRRIRGLQFFKYTTSPWVSRQSIAGINAGMDVAFRGKLRFNRGAVLFEHGWPFALVLRHMGTFRAEQAAKLQGSGRLMVTAASCGRRLPTSTPGAVRTK